MRGIGLADKAIPDFGGPSTSKFYILGVTNSNSNFQSDGDHHS